MQQWRQSSGKYARTPAANGQEEHSREFKWSPIWDSSRKKAIATKWDEQSALKCCKFEL